jgi:hypothetical protein
MHRSLQMAGVLFVAFVLVAASLGAAGSAFLDVRADCGLPCPFDDDCCDRCCDECGFCSAPAAIATALPVLAEQPEHAPLLVAATPARHVSPDPGDILHVPKLALS